VEPINCEHGTSEPDTQLGKNSTGQNLFSLKWLWKKFLI
jgi:hypothetical protein